MRQKSLIYAAIALGAAALPLPAIACAGCGCSVNSDWGAQGVSTAPGWSIDLRYDYLNQDQLRSGTHSIAPGVAANTMDPQSGGPAEVEKYTENRYATASLDYSNGASWGLNLVVPYIDRKHSTYGSASGFGASDGYPTGVNGYDSTASGLGDIKLIGRYFGFSPSKSFGLQLGLKLPTGKHDQLANDGVSQVDPGLQLGSGTTDLIASAYTFDNLNADWSTFAQAGVQTALNHSTLFGESYRPGDSLNLSLGIRYHGYSGFIPSLQVNGHYAVHDGGDAADTFSTGGTLVYLTPGVIVPIGHKASLYGDVQLPLYQDVRGIQLTPKEVISLGLRASF